MKNVWDLLKQLYKDQYGVDPIVVDYIAVHDILKLCCEGRSNVFISRKLNFQQKYVEAVLDEFFNFLGLSLDIGFNVRFVYLKYKFNKYSFVSVCRTLDPNFSESVYKLFFALNSTLDTIESEIERYYAKT